MQRAGVGEKDRLMDANWADAIVNFLMFLSAVVIALHGYRKWDVARREKRAEFLDKLLERFLQSEIYRPFYEYIEERGHSAHKKEVEVGVDIQHPMFYRGIENGIPSFTSREAERDIDRLLMFLSYICYLQDTGVIDMNEFSLFAYQIDATLANKEILNYLRDIRDYADMDDPYVYLSRRLEKMQPTARAQDTVCGLSDDAFRKYLCEAFGGMTASANSVLARARRVRQLLGKPSLTDLVSSEKIKNETLRQIDELKNVKNTVKANLKNAVKHCYKARFG